MPIQVEIKANRVGYMCLNCKKIKNPERDRPHIIRVLAGFQPTPNGLVSNFTDGLVDPDCFKKLERRGDICDADKVFPELREAANKPAPASNIERAASLPKDHLGKGGAPRGPQGPPAQPPKK